MDIILSYSFIKEYLDTNASVDQVIEALTLCGPTVDRYHKENGDTILELEVITNRVDSASAFGIAREAYGILPEFGHKAQLVNNPYQLKVKTFEKVDRLPLKVQILDQSLVKRFSCLVLDNVSVHESSKEIQEKLQMNGIRSLNNVIDISNELTLRLGQPVHIFDYDKLKANTMILRESNKGEEVVTLDGKKHQLKGKDIVMVDGEGRLIDLCGIMGGDLSKVDQYTKRIVLFVQTYDPKHIRYTSLYTQTRTLAAQLFEKNTDPELVMPTLLLGVEMLADRAGAKVASEVLDIYNRRPKVKQLRIEKGWLSKIAGVEVDEKKAIEILSRLGFKAEQNSKSLVVAVPSWRVHDVTRKEDIAEEVLRIMGYFRLPAVLPSIPANLEPDSTIVWEGITKRYLADVGFTEIYGNSLTSQKSLGLIGAIPKNVVRVTNPLSEDYELMRTSLIPGILEATALNIKYFPSTLGLFELSNVYLDWDGRSLPNEQSNLVMVSFDQDIRKFKGIIEVMFNKLRVNNLKYVTDNKDPLLSPCVRILINSQSVGRMGLTRQAISHKLDLPTLPIIELDFREIAKQAGSPYKYKPISKYPEIIEDITIESEKSIPELIAKIEKVSQLIVKTIYLDSYGNKHTFRIWFGLMERTLTKSEVALDKDKILKID